MAELYDRIGTAYSSYRRPDPRIAAAIARSLGDARSIVNVGAGTGSYEARDRELVAVEPSRTMIRQRDRAAAPAVQATAAALPFYDAAFDAAQAILTIHHWSDRARAFEELGRAARRRVVILTWDPDGPGFWLVDDYFPEIREADRRIFPTMSELARAFGGKVTVEPLLIPHDCTDGFLAAYWRRPAAYLDAGARSAISCFARIGDAGQGLQRLEDDLLSGEWARRCGHLLGESAIDFGYRLVTVAYA